MQFPRLPSALWAIFLISLLSATLLAAGGHWLEKRNTQQKGAWPRLTVSSPLKQIDLTALNGIWIAKSGQQQYTLTIKGSFFQLLIKDLRYSERTFYARGEVRAANGVLQFRLRPGLGRPRNPLRAYKTYFPLSFEALEFAVTELSSRLMTTLTAAPTASILNVNITSRDPNFLQKPLIWQRQG
ncbi:MAG: hypothetical protein GC136_00580 [Alphaproteobacteria bacterium]|nr:hypothetical protein [Alphaproteobacteria bacterium]